MSSPTSSSPQRPPISVTTTGPTTPMHTPTPMTSVPRRPTLGSRRSSRFAEEPMTEFTPVSSHFSLDAVDMGVAARLHSPPQQQQQPVPTPSPSSQQQPHRVLPPPRQSQSDRAASTETARRGPGGRRLFRRSSSSRGSARQPQQQGPTATTVATTTSTARETERVGYNEYEYGYGHDHGQLRYDGYRHHEDYDDEDYMPTTLDIGFRIVNATMHFASCLVLLLIVGSFLGSLHALQGGIGVRRVVPQAIVLCIFLVLDAIFDILSVALFRRSWPGWALLVRLAFGIGYLAIFMAYIGIGRVFPYGYTYWGLDRGYAGPVVYLFLWLIGVWNLLHTALHRHEFGHDMRRHFAALTSCCSRGRHARPASAQQTQQTRTVHRWPAFLHSAMMPRRPSFHLGRSAVSSLHHDSRDDALPSFEHSVPARGFAPDDAAGGGGVSTVHQIRRTGTAAAAAAAPVAHNYSSNSISLSDRGGGENKSVSQATTATTGSVDGRTASEERLPQLPAPGAKAMVVTTEEEVR